MKVATIFTGVVATLALSFLLSSCGESGKERREERKEHREERREERKENREERKDKEAEKTDAQMHDMKK